MSTNSISNSIPPTNPFHIARAYGVQPSAQVPRTQATGPASAAAAQVSPVADGNSIGSSGPAAKLPSAAQKLVGARVPGKVDFSGATPMPSAGPTLSMYRHPADKNAAATAVSVGRSLDVKG